MPESFSRAGVVAADLHPRFGSWFLLLLVVLAGFRVPEVRWGARRGAARCA